MEKFESTSFMLSVMFMGGKSPSSSSAAILLLRSRTVFISKHLEPPCIALLNI